MSFTFWLSIFGSLTGFAGLVLHFRRFLREQPKINIYLPSGELGKTLIGYVISDQQDSNGQFKTDTSRFTFYIWTRISNQSEKPITLLEFELSIPNIGTLHLDSLSICSNWLPINEISSRRINPLIKPIITLEPYSALEGYLFFSPYLFIPPDKTRAKLIIKTTRKTFNTKVIIRPVIPPSRENSLYCISLRLEIAKMVSRSPNHVLGNNKSLSEVQLQNWFCPSLDHPSPLTGS